MKLKKYYFKMNKQFTSYDIALKLKELGFNEECFGFYKTSLSNNTPELVIMKCNYNSGKYITIPEDFHVDAPLWQQATEWIREKYNWHIKISYYGDYFYQYKLGSKIYSIEPQNTCSTYEEALKIAILKVLDNITGKNE